MDKFTAIIPFYNEGIEIISVIKTIFEVNGINQIICVDDGSTNETHKLIKDRFPKVTLVRLFNNQGKSHAVFEGLERAENENILLIDGDLIGLRANDLQKIIDKFNETKSLDMIIMEVKGSNIIIDKILRKYIFQGGNRILRKKDLEKVFEDKPVGYQLEVAINKYAMENNKEVRWAKCSAFNPHKFNKMTFWQGMIKDLKMDAQIISFLGLQNYIRQILFFCREELK